MFYISYFLYELSDLLIVLLQIHLVGMYCSTVGPATRDVPMFRSEELIILSLSKQQAHYNDANKKFKLRDWAALEKATCGRLSVPVFVSKIDISAVQQERLYATTKEWFCNKIDTKHWLFSIQFDFIRHGRPSFRP